MRYAQDAMITTDYVLDETYTFLYSHIPVVNARMAMDAIVEGIERKYIDLCWITPERFAIVQKLRLKFQDKPNISFTDITSMAVMQELGISKILTGDAHFTHVGMEFTLLP